LFENYKKVDSRVKHIHVHTPLKTLFKVTRLVPTSLTNLIVIKLTVANYGTVMALIDNESSIDDMFYN